MDTAIKKKMKYSFDHFVMVCKIYKSKLVGKKNKKGTVQEYYTNREEELFSQVHLLFRDRRYSEKHKDAVVRKIF